MSRAEERPAWGWAEYALKKKKTYNIREEVTLVLSAVR